MRFTWHEPKRRANIRKHGIDFVDATEIFADATVEQQDDREEYGEVRIVAIGKLRGVLVTVIYADRDEDERRIISAWESTPYEKRTYHREILS